MSIRISFALLLLLFISCKKQVQETQSNRFIANGETIANPIPTPPYNWILGTTGFLNQYPQSCTTCPSLLIPVNNDVYLLTGSLYEIIYRFNNSLRRFERYNPPSSGDVGFTVFTAGHQYLFSFGGKIYGGLRDGGTDRSFFFSLDPLTNTTQALSRFPGTFTADALSFVIGNKGYIISGFTATTTSRVWEYNFGTNTWTNIGDSPLGKRNSATVLVVNDKAYMGLGYETITLNGQSTRLYKKDWIQYVPGATYHAAVANFPGNGRNNAKGFVMDGNLYLGFGENISSTTRFKDFWKYDPTANTWAQQESWPGIYGIDDSWTGARHNSIGIFSNGSSGYLVRGGLSQLWYFINAPLLNN